VGVAHRDQLRAVGAVAALVGRTIGPGDNILPRAVARTDRVTQPGHRHRPATTVARRYTAGVRRRHLAGATDRQIGRTSDARPISVVDGDGLRASIAIAALVGRPVNT